MKHQTIVNKITRYKINSTAIISNGLVHHTPKQMILKQLSKELDFLAHECALARNEIHQLWLDTYNEYQVVSKATFSTLVRIEKKFGKETDYAEALKQRKEAVYSTVHEKIIMPQKLVHEKNRLSRMIEFREKHDYVYGDDGLLAASHKSEGGYSPFFLCSSHVNPAKDHEDWEGKMYYDADYTEYISDQQTLARVNAYIRNHRLQTVQWVCGAPVYLITRPHCKHYFRNIAIEEVLHSSAKSLLKRHRLYMQHKEPMSYEESVLNNLKTRLSTETKLYTLMKPEGLKKDIAKDKALVMKWSIRAAQKRSSV